MAQNSTVTGTVVDENNDPVIGASILVEGTARGTITDIEGKFTISGVPASAKNLQVSYVGMRTQLVPITSGNIQIVMKNDAEVLDEVMVVAYGTTTKASFTGSASVMRDTDMSAQRQSLVKSFEGKVAGVRVGASTGDPGSDQAITIRGIGSVNGSTQPLYVVDGVPISNESMISSGVRSPSVLSRYGITRTANTMTSSLSTVPEVRSIPDIISSVSPRRLPTMPLRPLRRDG